MATKTNKELVESLQRDIPVFSLEVLISLGLQYVSGVSFENTNLSGSEDSHICELSPSQLEKLILYAAGFTRDLRYAAKHDVLVSKEDSSKKTGQKIISTVQNFFDQNCNVGLRVHNGFSRVNTTKPFTWAPLGDTKFIKISKDQVSLRLVDGSDHILMPGDKIQIFSSPVSVDRNMLEKGSKTEKIVNMGGGVICKLNNFDPVRNIFTLNFNFITNNGNPRNIGDNNEKYPEYELRVTVKEEDGKFVVIKNTPEKSLQECVDSKKMEEVLQYVAEQMVFQESGALFKLFSTVLSLYPKLKFHAVKGFYAIEEDTKAGINKAEKLKFSSMFFDIESAEQGQLWDAGANKANVKNPSSLLKQIYEKLNVQNRELDGSDRLLLAHLAMKGYVFPQISLIEGDLKANLVHFERYLHEKLSGGDAFQAVDIIQTETKAIIDSLSRSEYKNNSPELLFGKLLWVALGSKKFRKVGEGIFEYEFGSNTAVLLDQGDYKVGFLIQDKKIIDLSKYLKKFKTKNRHEKLAKLGNLISQKFNIQIVKAMFEYVLG